MQRDRIQWRVLGESRTPRRTPFSAQGDTEQIARDLAARSAEEIDFHSVQRCRLTYGTGELPHLPEWHVEEERPYLDA